MQPITSSNVLAEVPRLLDGSQPRGENTLAALPYRSTSCIYSAGSPMVAYGALERLPQHLERRLHQISNTTSDRWLHAGEMIWPRPLTATRRLFSIVASSQRLKSTAKPSHAGALGPLAQPSPHCLHHSSAATVVGFAARPLAPRPASLAHLFFSEM